MDSRTAAHVLSEIAAFLAFRAENQFKARAYRNAAKAVLALNADDLTPLYRSGELASVRGLGRATLAVIADLVENGESRYLEQLRQHVPEGVVELMRVPGLTPVKIQQIHEALGVSTVDELEAAARDGRLAAVRGFGAKTGANLVDAIAFMRRTSALTLYPRAAVEAARLLEAVRRHPDVVIGAIAGSVRRHNEVVRNVDIVAGVRAGRGDGVDHGAADPAAVAASFANASGVVESSVAGGSASVRYVDGTLLNLRCVSEDAFAVALWRATGSASHVAQMSAALAARGFFVDDDQVRDIRGERVPVRDEPALYA